MKLFSRNIPGFVLVMVFQILTSHHKTMASTTYDYMVHVRNDEGICGGVVIRPSWILVSSGCLKRRIKLHTQKFAYPYLGPVVKQRPRFSQPFYTVTRTKMCHEPGCYLALLKVDMTIMEPSAKLHKIQKDQDSPCKNAQPEFIHFNGTDPPYNMIKTNITIVPCPEFYEDWYICGNLTCSLEGISDGPLVCGKMVVGFLDWDSCDAEGNSTVFVSVSNFSDFIYGISTEKGDIFKHAMSHGWRCNGCQVYKFFMIIILLLALPYS